MIYEYAIRCASYTMVGVLEVPSGTSIEDATRQAGLKGAQMACAIGLEWDPWNVQIAVKPLQPENPASTPRATN